MSGIVSIVGAGVAHLGSVKQQLNEVVVLLRALLHAAGTTSVGSLVAYMKSAEHEALVERMLRAYFPSAALTLVKADLSRDDLLIEIDVMAYRKQATASSGRNHWWRN